MITRTAYEAARTFAWDAVKRSGVPVGEHEREQIEAADLGLSEFHITGAAILTLASTDWMGVKLLILAPNQFFPQHRHPPSDTENYPGKQEIFRCQSGEIYIYMPGEAAAQPKADPPAHRRPYLTVWHETSLRPGEQVMSPPNTWHWFQAGAEGAVCWSFSSKVTDAVDQFTDPQVTRKTIISED
jgi:D-lyxose ketol-isomerase